MSREGRARTFAKDRRRRRCRRRAHRAFRTAPPAWRRRERQSAADGPSRATSLLLVVILLFLPVGLRRARSEDAHAAVERLELDLRAPVAADVGVPAAAARLPLRLEAETLAE